MKKRGIKRKCPYCKKTFTPDARNQHYQQYCSETSECKKESHKNIRNEKKKYKTRNNGIQIRKRHNNF